MYKWRKNVETISSSSQLTTQNNQQSVQNHRFNIEQRYEQGAQRQMDDTFYKDVVYDNDLSHKKLHKFEEWEVCHRYLHVTTGSPPLTTSPCLRAPLDSSGCFGFQGIFTSFNLSCFKETVCLCGLGFFKKDV